MIGIIVELIISWLLLWFICKKHLSVLGFRPTKDRMTNLMVGLFIAASCCTLWQLMTTAFIDNGWVLNKQATAKGILESSRWTLVSVLYEELIFRGALLIHCNKKIRCCKSMYSFGSLLWHLPLVFLQRLWKPVHDGHCFFNDSDSRTFLGFCICQDRLSLLTNRFAFRLEFIFYCCLF